MTGRPAAASRRFSVAARSWWRTRSSGWALTWRTLASAAGGDRGRQRGREDEARAAGAHEVDGGGGRGDVAADHAERLGERALHDVDLVERAVALGHAGAARAVHADGMDLVEIGEGAVAMGDVADLADRRDVAVHRVDRFEGDDLGRRRIGAGQQLLEMGHVVVAEDPAHRAGVADAGDHRGVVERVGIELAARQHGAQRLQRRLVGDIARGEDERGFLAVQRGELALERDVQRVGAGDVARAAGARALRVDRGLHGLDHGRMLAHGEIVVAAPHGDVARLLRPRDAGARAGRRRRSAPARRTRDSGLRRAGGADGRRKMPRSPFCRLSPARPILVGLVSFPQAHFGRGVAGRRRHEGVSSIKSASQSHRLGRAPLTEA